MKKNLVDFEQAMALKTVKILPDDYNELLVDGGLMPSPSNHYKEIPMVERVINGKKVYQIYILEPSRIYQINVFNKIGADLEDAIFLHTTLIESLAAAGLLLLFSNSEQLYVKNCSTNPIYVKKDAEIAVQYYLK